MISLLVPFSNPLNIDSIDICNSYQYHFRSVIETVFARVRTFKATDIRFKQSVTTNYQIIAYNLKESPLRNEEFFYN
jgi:hypothetical protein